MDTKKTASLVLAAVGGTDNILTNSICMTRLRLGLKDRGIVDSDALRDIHGVIGTAPRGTNGLEVVFGPAVIDKVYDEFAALTSIGASKRSKARGEVAHISPKKAPAVTQAIRHRGGDEKLLSESDVEKLRELLDEPDDIPAEKVAGPRILIINGPNINMLGVREPEIYGKKNFAALVDLCHKAGKEAGCSATFCFQSNHEGDIVDEIQSAYNTYDGIVINPAAYTHTSVAILDALKAVSIPTVEVHISAVDAREEFRKTSYVRAACIETISGMGIEGYRKAILDLVRHLEKTKG